MEAVSETEIGVQEFDQDMVWELPPVDKKVIKQKGVERDVEL